MTGDGTTLFLDTETFCETPIKDGTHRYAEGVEIMIAAWALDDPLWGEGEIIVEDLVDDWGHTIHEPSADLARAIKTAQTIVMHNGGQFDRTVIHHAWDIDIPLHKIEDTMAQAMAHGLPGGLDKLSAIFKLGEDSKHEGGRELIRLFCMPAPKKQKLRRRDKTTHPAEWQRFLRYAGGDIQSMRALRAKLPTWNYPGKRGNHATGHDAWVLDQTINDRGFKVDTDLAREAIDMVERCKDKYDEYVEETTLGEVQTAAQTQKLLAHLLGFYGVSLPDMQKGTLERRMDDPNLPDVVKELLSVRLDVAKASPTKYAALLRSASSDGRLRGTTQFCGAVRTGRSAGRIFQAKNLIRPNDAEAQQQDAWVEAIKSGAGEMFLDNPTRAAGVCLRGSVIAEPGKKLVVADLAQVEARVLAWGAGEEWKLQAFRDFDAGLGPDVYKVTAGRILRKHADDVTKDERQMMGKVPDLACGFQGAAGAFGTMMRLYGLDLETKEVKRIVDEWRETNSMIKQFWYDLEAAAREATLNPGVTTRAGEYVSFNRWREWLRMKLPSGHVLCYTQPRIEPHKKFANATALSYLGVNSYTRKWERIQTYGGKLAENWTQATATGVWGVIGDAMLRAEAAGYAIVMETYDELVCEVPDTEEFTTEGLCAILAERPWWADERLPLAAEGFTATRYRK